MGLKAEIGPFSREIPYRRKICWNLSCQTACKPGSVRVLPRWTAIPLGRASRHASRDQPGRRDGNVPALCPKTEGSRPYSVLLPVGFTVPPLLPGARCALTAPFRPDPREPNSCAGGLFSVALSLGSPPPAINRHRIPVEPGLSSAPSRRQRPSSRLASAGHGRGRGARQAVS